MADSSKPIVPGGDTVGTVGAFGYGVAPRHMEDGNNDIRCAVRGGTDSTWLIELRAFGP